MERFKFYKFKGFNQLKTLIFGSTSSFLINVVALLIYSRIYSKEQIGIYALFVSVITIGAILATFRLENVVVLQKTKREAAFISSISNHLVLLFSIVLLVLAILLVSFSVLFFNSSSYIWIFIPIAVFTFANTNIFLSWNNKIKKYQLISSYRLIQSLSIAVLVIALGYFNIVQGLIIGYTFGIFLSYIFLLVKFKAEQSKFHFGKVTFRKLADVLQTNKDIINASYGLGFMQTISRFLPNFILNFFYGSGIVGIYDMTIKILNIPKNIISVNIGELYYQKANLFYLRGNSQFKKITISTTWLLLLLGSVSYLPFYLYGTELFTLFLGEKWKLSGELSEIITVWYIILFITSPMAYLYYIKRILNKLLWFSIVSFSIKIITLVYFANFTDSFSTIKIYTFICMLLELVLLGFVLANSNIKNKKDS